MPILANMLVRVGVTGTNTLDRDFRKAQRSVKQFAGELEDVGRRLTIGITLPLVAAGAAVLRTASDFDGLRRGLIAVSGSAEEAEKQLTRLREVAKTPGLGFREAIQGSTALQAAGFSAQLAERSLRSFGNALATIGKGKAELDGVTLALTQIIASGKVLGQEVRQLQQRLPQIRQAMISAFGTARSDEIQELGIDAKTFVEAMVAEFEKLPQVTTGLKNEMENLQDSVEVALAGAGRAVEPFARVVIQELDKVVQKIAEVSDSFRALPQDTQANLLRAVAVIAAIPVATLITAKFITAFAVIETFLVGRLVPAAATAAGAITTRLLPAVAAIGPAAASATPAVLALQGALIAAAGAVAAFALIDLGQAISYWIDGLDRAKQAEEDLARTTAVLETRLRQAGVNTKELRQRWIEGAFEGKLWRQVLNDVAVELGNQRQAADDAAKGTEGHSRSVKDQIAAQKAAKEAAERLTKAYQDLKLEPGREQQLADSLRILSGELDAGRLTLQQYIRALGNYRDEIEKLATAPPIPQPIPSPIAPGLDAPLDLGVLDQIESFERGRQAIAELVDAYNSGMLAMQEGTGNLQRTIDLFAPSFENLRRQIDEMRLEEFAEKLGVTLTRDLQQTRDEAQQLFDEITNSADATAVDRLKATARLIDAEIALWRELAFQATEADRERIEEYIGNLEKQERDTRAVLNRITGSHRRATDQAARFWRAMGRQVSLIINDLSREIANVLFPRNQGEQRDIAGITDLGIRAGVTGEQLEQLARTIEDLAVATGQNFGTLATAAGDLFQTFKVGAQEQIPLLEELFDIATGGNLRIADLFRTMQGGAEVFAALGIGAREGAALIARLEQEGLDADEIFSNLQTTLDKLTAQGFARPAEELQEIIDRIRTAGTAAQANAIAVTHFGDAGVEMARLIRAGALDLDGLSTAFQDVGKDIADTAAEVRKFDEEVNQVSGVRRIFDEIGRSIVRALVEQGVRAVGRLLDELDLLKSAGRAIASIFTTIAEKLGIIDTAAGSVLDQLPRRVPIGGTPTVPDIGTPGAGTGGGAGLGAGGGTSFGDFLNPFKFGFDLVMDIGNAYLLGRIERDIARIEVSTRFVKRFVEFRHLPHILGVGVQLSKIRTDVQTIRGLLARTVSFAPIATEPPIDTPGDTSTPLENIEGHVEGLYFWSLVDWANWSSAQVTVLRDIATNVRSLASAFELPQYAMAGGGLTLPAAAERIQGDVNIGTLNIDGLNVRDPGMVREISQVIARHNVARGVRGRRRVR